VGQRGIEQWLVDIGQSVGQRGIEQWLVDIGPKCGTEGNRTVFG